MEIEGKSECDKACDDLYKNGYRDGIDKGRNESLQHYFDASYQLCFKFYKNLGILKGLVVSQMIINSSSGADNETTPVLENLVTQLENEEQYISNYNFPSSDKDFDTTLKEIESEWSQKLQNHISQVRQNCPNVDQQLLTLE